MLVLMEINHGFTSNTSKKYMVIDVKSLSAQNKEYFTKKKIKP